MLRAFDKNVDEAQAALVAASDADLQEPSSFLNNGTTLFSMARMTCLRSWACIYG